MTTPSQTIRTSSNAIISLICGILAWLGVFGLGGVLAVIFGHAAKKEIRTAMGRVSGDGMATAGLILGYLNIAMAIVGACLAILVITGAIAIPLFLIPFVE
ncbi:MAG: DUF4190 domain-containing protein [Anaerolineaceae bacterium]|nr:DUF4190 domain-containing protein [Anaerolineaceae bacterium]